jgi:hypothetical protein
MVKTRHFKYHKQVVKILCDSQQCTFDSNAESNDILLQYQDYGIIVDPTKVWNGHVDNQFKFVIRGISDSDYAKDKAATKSVSGNADFF